MWIFVGKNASRFGVQIVRQVSNFADDLGESLLEAKKVFLKNDENKKKVRSLRIAILGLPNAGKSTLINHLIGRPVCAASSKIHTTKNKAAAVYCEDDTQLIFIDTPGLVSKRDCKRYQLTQTFLKDPEDSMKEADVIGIVQDMSNFLSRKDISKKLIDYMKLGREDVNSILILNKVDLIKNKKILLEYVDRVNKKYQDPKFVDIFMISALTGDGVGDLRNYFLDIAKQRDWDFKEDALTDQPMEKVFAEVVRSKLLNNLPQEMPYQIISSIEYIHPIEDGSMNVLSNLHCPSDRIARMLIGRKGERIKKIAKEAEEQMCMIFQRTIRLKVLVRMDDEDKKTPIKSVMHSI